MMTIQFRLDSICTSLTQAYWGSACLIGLWIFVTSTTLAQTVVQRDPQAIAILSQAIAVGGGQDLLNSIQDFTETGAVTYYLQDQITGNATIKSRGSNQLKLAADLSTGQRTIVVSANSGALTDVDGSSRPISGQTAADLGNIMSPYEPLIAAIRDSSISVINGGQVNHDGTSTYDIRIQNTYTAAQDPEGTRGAREARDFYIDASVFVVVAISDQLHFTTNDEGITHEIDYSNYQPESGVLMPLGVTESLNGTPDCSIAVTQVAFNSGLTNDDFSW
jgi:hypothetical protein